MPKRPSPPPPPPLDMRTRQSGRFFFEETPSEARSRINDPKPWGIVLRVRDLAEVAGLVFGAIVLANWIYRLWDGGKL